MADPAEQTAMAELVINLAAVVENYRGLAALAPTAECAAAVKANAYGLGLVPVSRALHKAGCQTFFVATPDEGLTLRDAQDDVIIYVLNGLPEGGETLFAENDLRPVLNNLPEIERWQRADLGQNVPACAIHIDTGMTRLGLDMADVKQLASTPWPDSRPVALIMSHLAAANQPKDPMNEKQRQRFDEASDLLNQAGLSDAKRSLANTSGISLGVDFHYDLVRPGIGLFAADDTTNDLNKTIETIELNTKISQVRSVTKGQTVGYGNAGEMPHDGKVATLPVGYGDGYPRSLGHVGYVLVNGHQAPIVGRISMDLMTVDITGLPDDLAQPGTPVTLMGPDLPPDQIGQWAGTISYEILTGLSQRLFRRYTGA